MVLLLVWQCRAVNAVNDGLVSMVNWWLVVVDPVVGGGDRCNGGGGGAGVWAGG